MPNITALFSNFPFAITLNVPFCSPPSFLGINTFIAFVSPLNVSCSSFCKFVALTPSGTFPSNTILKLSILTLDLISNS